MLKRGYHHGNLREALIAGAVKLIAERGPQGFTLSEAAREAGVTPAAVYRHFEGRDDLIAEVARQGYEMFADLLAYAYDEGKPTALAAFEATGRAYLAFARKYPGHYVAMFELGMSMNRTPELAAAARRALGVIEQAAITLSQHIPRTPPAAVDVRRAYLGLVARCGGTFRARHTGQPLAPAARAVAGKRHRDLSARSGTDPAGQVTGISRVSDAPRFSRKSRLPGAAVQIRP